VLRPINIGVFMKKVVYLLIFALLITYGLGRARLGEAGAMRFLGNMESLMNEGKADEVCDMFHDDLEIEIADSSGDLPRHFRGGKKEMCDLTRETAAGLAMLPHDMSVNYTEVNSKLDWAHPWTGELSYLENRALTVMGTNVTLRTVSKDQIMLVHTLSGVKLRKLKSEVYKADAT
jgi:hypothetical protein